jgi:hypothetical protein
MIVLLGIVYKYENIFIILINIILLINTQILVCPHRLDIIVYVHLLIYYILGVLYLLLYVRSIFSSLIRAYLNYSTGCQCTRIL